MNLKNALATLKKVIYICEGLSRRSRPSSALWSSTLNAKLQPSGTYSVSQSSHNVKENLLTKVYEAIAELKKSVKAQQQNIRVLRDEAVGSVNMYEELADARISNMSVNQFKNHKHWEMLAKEAEKKSLTALSKGNMKEALSKKREQLQELKTLKESLRQAKLELTMSKVELNEAKNSLRIAKQSLKQLEKEVQPSRKEHSMGIGQGTAGVAVLLEYNPSNWYGAWVYSDKQNKTVGLKINF